MRPLITIALPSFHVAKQASGLVVEIALIAMLAVEVTPTLSLTQQPLESRAGQNCIDFPVLTNAP